MTTYWHGTLVGNLPSIEREGLLPDENGRVYVTRDYRVAYQYAEGKAAYYADMVEGTLSARAIRVRLTRRQERSLEPDPIAHDWAKAYRHAGPIPPACISR